MQRSAVLVLQVTVFVFFSVLTSSYCRSLTIFLLQSFVIMWLQAKSLFAFITPLVWIISPLVCSCSCSHLTHRQIHPAIARTSPLTGEMPGDMGKGNNRKLGTLGERGVSRGYVDYEPCTWLWLASYLAPTARLGRPRFLTLVPGLTYNSLFRIPPWSWRRYPFFFFFTDISNSRLSLVKCSCFCFSEDTPKVCLSCTLLYLCATNQITQIGDKAVWTEAADGTTLLFPSRKKQTLCPFPLQLWLNYLLSCLQYYVVPLEVVE